MDLKIVAVNNSKKNATVQKVELNGKVIDLSYPFVKHSGTTAVHDPSFNKLLVLLILSIQSSFLEVAWSSG
jgi:hypothetical protein